jgi:hypothetical protein
LKVLHETIEEEKTMGTSLLHDPWVQFYLLYAAVLFVVHLRAYLSALDAIQNDSRTPRNEAAHGAHGLSLSAASQTPSRSVSRPGRRTDKEAEPIPGDRRFQTPIRSHPLHVFWTHER